MDFGINIGKLRGIKLLFKTVSNMAFNGTSLRNRGEDIWSGNFRVPQYLKEN